MAINLDGAAPYNLFVLGDVNKSNSDTEGRLAAAGNVTLENYSIGDRITPSPDPIW